MTLSPALCSVFYNVTGPLLSQVFYFIQLHLNQATLSDEEIETHTISAWKALKFQQNREGVRASEPLYGRSLVQVNALDLVFNLLTVEHLACPC